ncbi:NADH-dependent flavin oxidoreductase [Vagococcus sp. BWB3-3]|uniref:NADH-dependent flavin oxidoreductase n=1 Tax=Vagococcus allomyrinae TaxID=2794353 RepID=A0A940SUI2_9ENTE|nr:NADH-dependent flavin oxidoreductase [Vagococcus allomyrinae]MBP1044337.1 NADH-dependent flavin oxidoreductase [Vagococcus allomyrinae]
MMSKYQFLESYRFKNGMTVKNRIVMAPMTTMSSFHDGQVTNDEVAYYAARAGGPGMIITGVANVSESGKGFEGELSVTDDRFIPGLAKVAAAIKQDGTKAILQIFHAGRMSNSSILRGKQAVSASAIAAARAGAEVPRELTETEILTIIDEFGQATRRAIAAGFDGVELHGANTYLLQQFVSPHSNRRTDRWGGSFEKRLAFPLAVIAKVKGIIAEAAKEPFVLGYRFSPEEFETPGIRFSDTLAFVKKVKSELDYLHISLGHVWRTPMNDQSNQLPVVTSIKEAIGELPLIGVGSLETPEEVEKVLAQGVEFAALGRELIREPKWVQKVIRHDQSSIRYKISPSDFDELTIPRAMQHYLQTSFREVIHLSTDETTESNAYLKEVAPMEGYEKKL